MACDDGAIMPQSDVTQPYHHGALREAAVSMTVARLRAGDHELPTLREIARQIGVTHRALYRYFADKEALRNAVAGEGFSLLAAAMEAVQPITQKSVMDGYLRFAFSEPSLYHLMFSLRASALMAAPVPGAQVRQVIALATSVYDDGSDESAVQDKVLSAWGMAHGLYELWRNGALRASNSDIARAFILAQLASSLLV
jgi:AcrR family transcriptional regulator